MRKYNTYVGMDVHARTIVCAALVIATGESERKTFGSCPSPADIASWIQTLPGPAYAAYESGCTGFGLCRGLREAGIDCNVIAVSTMARSSKRSKQKCDKLDASAILATIANPASDHTCVWCPDEETEGARDLARAADEAVASLKRARQQLSALLLRHGYVWSEKTPMGRPKKRWTKDFWAWVDSIELPDTLARDALALYRQAVKCAEELVAQAKKALAQAAGSPRWKPYVDAISALKGIDVQGAFLAAAEFGDFERFSSGRKVSCWLGTVPSNSSSGVSERHGGITKAGNSRLRHILVEGNASIARRKVGRKKRIPAGRVVSSGVARMADEANVRLSEKYVHLISAGKPPCKARMAVVNEQVRWIWAIGCAVQAEQGVSA